MNYKILGKIPIQEILQRLEEGAPHLYRELQASPKSAEGKYVVSHDLAQRIDKFLLNEESRAELRRFHQELTASIQQGRERRLQEAFEQAEHAASLARQGKQ